MSKQDRTRADARFNKTNPAKAGRSEQDIAAKAVLERLALPKRIMVLLEGESLMNDAAGAARSLEQALSPLRPTARANTRVGPLERPGYSSARRCAGRADSVALCSQPPDTDTPLGRAERRRTRRNPARRQPCRRDKAVRPKFLVNASKCLSHSLCTRLACIQMLKDQSTLS